MPVALEDLDPIGMRRAESIDLRLVVLSDGIDDERVAALVVADGLPIPGTARIFRMGHIQIDEASLAISRVEDDDLRGCLQNLNGGAASIQDHGHTRWPT